MRSSRTDLSDGVTVFVKSVITFTVLLLLLLLLVFSENVRSIPSTSDRRIVESEGPIPTPVIPVSKTIKKRKEKIQRQKYKSIVVVLSLCQNSIKFLEKKNFFLLYFNIFRRRRTPGLDLPSSTTAEATSPVRERAITRKLTSFCSPLSFPVPPPDGRQDGSLDTRDVSDFELKEDDRTTHFDSFPLLLTVEWSPSDPSLRPLVCPKY